MATTEQRQSPAITLPLGRKFDFLKMRTVILATWSVKGVIFCPSKNRNNTEKPLVTVSLSSTKQYLKDAIAVIKEIIYGV
jgi:hypothetical protein